MGSYVKQLSTPYCTLVLQSASSELNSSVGAQPDPFKKKKKAYSVVKNVVAWQKKSGVGAEPEC